MRKSIACQEPVIMAGTKTIAANSTTSGITNSKRKICQCLAVRKNFLNVVIIFRNSLSSLGYVRLTTDLYHNRHPFRRRLASVRLRRMRDPQMRGGARAALQLQPNRQAVPPRWAHYFAPLVYGRHGD